MLRNDFFNIFGFNHTVETAFGINNHNGTERAKTETAGFDNVDFVGKIVFFKIFIKCVNNFFTAR